MKGKKRKTFMRIIIIAILFIFFASSDFIIQYQWFQEVGYTQVFLKGLITKIQIGIPIFVLLTIILYIYFVILKTIYNKKLRVFFSPEKNKKENRWLLLGVIILCLFFTIIITSNLWYDLLEFINSTDFSIKDPVFHKDMSFYIFQLPLIEQIYSTGLIILIFMTMASLGFYIFLLIRNGTKQGIFHNKKEDRIDLKYILQEFFSLASKQLAIMVGAFFLILALGYYIKTFGILFTPGNLVYGAGYTDIHITLWIYRISMIIAVISAVLIIIAGYRKKLKLALVGPICLIGVGILGNIISFGVQNLIVSPNELVKEQPYIQNHINYTRQAYDLNDIERKQFPAKQDLNAQDIKENEITIGNIPINDYKPTLSMYNSLQGFRRYYQFYDIDIDRYLINGDYTQVFLSARELNQEKMDENSKTWINQHLKYTHGFGAAVSPVNRVNSSGQPDLVIKDIPPQGVEELKITEPRIYFGEMTNNNVITNARIKEFDYPKGDNNAEYFYTGTAGISLNWFNRFLFAIHEGSPRILLSRDITSDSKILINRNIVERVQKIAPFFIYDEDPYLVIDNGKLYWIIDAFTSSDRYAYSQPVKEKSFNYIRNSVKVVVDAFNGDVTFYQIDKEDPIINTYGKIYPDLLKNIEEMPKGIRDHIRYSQKYFDIQSQIYATYHMENPTVFYNKEDVWQIATQIYGTANQEEDQKVESAYIIMQDPDKEEEEFMLMVPYTPRERDNMVSWLAASNDGEDYGKLIVYKFPKQKLVYGPMQIEKRIDQDTEISKELTLLDQQGSNVIRGNLLTIPIEQSILFVEPIYIQSTGEDNNLPEVKRVIIAYENKITMKETLEQGLNEIFGIQEEKQQEKETDSEKMMKGTNQELILQANELFKKAQEAQKQGDWGKYGEFLKELQEILNELEQMVSES
ncbi:UPF0182 family protein [Garciella nitratireducens]|uniref:UPF0182 family membrane protein n=1 Tax=Garciella nitratireducens TaxID=218205 RepID=UPI001BD2AD85|nr:UPF0182 family protein [Garciella nitratireducens]